MRCKELGVRSSGTATLSKAVSFLHTDELNPGLDCSYTSRIRPKRNSILCGRPAERSASQLATTPLLTPHTSLLTNRREL